MDDNKTRALSDAEAKALRAGRAHYTAFVGPPEQYDFMGATQFRLLCALGLRERHRVLDFGCGSLRAGRLLIPYLQPGGYFGIEPNAWLVQDGIDRQVGPDQVRLKRPTFSHSEAFDAGVFGETFDFIVAQSIFSHAGPDLARRALDGFARCLRPDGLCLVTFSEGDVDTPDGWFYNGMTTPGGVRYRPGLIRALAGEAGLEAVRLDWHHPRQVWWLMGRALPPEAELRLLTGVVLRDPEFRRGVDRALAGEAGRATDADPGGRPRRQGRGPGDNPWRVSD